MAALENREGHLSALYREYTLALVWMRRVPEYIDDSTVAYHLLKCGETESLPWEIADEDFDDLWRTKNDIPHLRQ